VVDNIRHVLVHGRKFVRPLAVALAKGESYEFVPIKTEFVPIRTEFVPTTRKSLSLPAGNYLELDRVRGDVVLLSECYDLKFVLMWTSF
jgi:hypothetical protein